MTGNQITLRLFDLSNRLSAKSKEMLAASDRTKDDVLVALTLEFISEQIVEVFADIVHCEGEA